MATFRLKDGTGAITLRYIVEDRDRHGNVRLYVRRSGVPKVRLKETPGTDAFMEEYRRAVGGIPVSRPSGTPKMIPAAKGTLLWLVQQYLASGEFRQLHASTRKVRRGILEAACLELVGKGKCYGDGPYRQLEPRHVMQLRDRKADVPGAANNRVKALGYVFGWACGPVALATTNPCRGIPKLRPKRAGGHVAWGADQCAAYEAQHPVGTQARLAYEIFRETDLRRSDACRLGPQHVKAGRIRMTLQKGSSTAPVDIDIPMSGRLLAAIEATPRAQSHLAYLVTYQGRPYTPNGLGNAMRDWCDQAGLRGYSAHGLRKHGATAMAEGGASEAELMAYHGWRDGAQAQHYIKGARVAVLADNAAARRRDGETEQIGSKNVPPKTGIAESGTKSGKSSNQINGHLAAW